VGICGKKGPKSPCTAVAAAARDVRIGGGWGVERDGSGWWRQTHADHVEGVHADVGDDFDDLILRHELHLQHRQDRSKNWVASHFTSL